LIHSLDCRIDLSWVFAQVVVQSLQSTPSPFNTARCPLLISLTVRHLRSRQHESPPSLQGYTHPANAMVIRNSAMRILTASSTPCCPLYCPDHQFFSPLVYPIRTYSKSPYRYPSHEYEIGTQCQCLEDITAPSYATVECDWYLAFGDRCTISKAIERCWDTLERISR
jgi:hypothetical protein